MMRRSLLVGLVVSWAALATATALASPDAAAKDAARGSEALAKADFDGALKAYMAAARHDGDNAEYREKVGLLQRVIQLRKSLPKLDGQRWIAAADALHAFYVDNNLHNEALTLDRQVHEKQPSADSAAKLARTHLALNQNAEAAGVLRSVATDQATPETRVLLGRALGRQGKLDEARAAIAGITPPEDASGLLLFDLACGQALTGQADQALAMLSRSFEATPPSRLALLKSQAQDCPDLASLKTRPEFAKVLATESKVVESKCSSGASCAKCPSRDKCSDDQKKKDGHSDDKPKP